MKRALWLAFIALGCALLIVGGKLTLNARRRASSPEGDLPSAALPEPQDDAVSGEALVQFESSVTDGEAARLIREAGASVKERIDPQRIYVVSFASDASPQEMLARFKQMPGVSVAEPNGIYKPFEATSSGEWSSESSRSPLGAGAKVKIAVIDTAVDATHSALRGRIGGGYNFTTNSTDTQSRGVGGDWHGSAVSGRVLDGAGDANIEIMPLQVFNDQGGASWSNIIKAINYAVNNGAQVINLSLGGYARSALVQQAISAAVRRGVVVVASAGNVPWERKTYPAAYRGVISVAATNERGRKANFSSYGSWVDMSANGDSQRLLSHGGYTYGRGTSFSAPFIAGMAAMLKSAFPDLTAAQVEQIIKARANDVDSINQRYYRGKLGAGYLAGADVTRWMAEIRAGSFTFPWQTSPRSPRYGRHFMQRPAGDADTDTSREK